MFHMHGKRECGPRSGRWSRGPFSVEWTMEDGAGRHGMGGRGGGGRRRMFDGGELRLVLLKLISDQPRHGYDLIRDIEERTGGAYAPSPGVVYPTLTLLADMGAIDETPSEGSRKLFAITDAGQAMLAEKAEEVAALLARLGEIGEARARTDGGPVRRAMANLRTVLHQRLSAEGVSADTLHDVAELLDEAARKIERLS